MALNREQQIHLNPLAEIDRLRADNAKLEAALKHLMHDCELPYDSPAYSKAREAIEEARK